MGKKANWSWDNVRYFLAVAQYGTLSDAARQLGVSHSTVQRRIAALESELQTGLFSKTATGYLMTPAGNALFSEAEQMQTTLESVSRKISGSDADVSGEVVITSTDTLSFLVLPELIRTLAEVYPALSVTLSMLNRLSDVQNLEADIAIRTCKEPPVNLIGRKIATINFSVVASRWYCHSRRIDAMPADLSRHRLIALDESYAGTSFYQWFAKYTGSGSHVTRANGFLGAYSLCKAGVGIAMLPSYMADDVADLQVLEGFSNPPSNQLWILSHSDLRDTERVRVVRQFLFDKLSQRFNRSKTQSASSV